MSKRAQIIIGVVVAFFAIGIIGTAAGSGKKAKTTAPPAATTSTVPVAATTVTTVSSSTTDTVAPTTTQAPKPTAPPAPVETAGQANARRSAEQYLSLGNGFSRTGLIQQLSSSAGEGFSLADATYGVDATHTDWNAQACLSAKGYLKLQAFSHAGLVQQLSSAAGDGYTVAQAEYGTTCAGL